MCMRITNDTAKGIGFFATKEHEFVFSDGFGTSKLIYDLTEYRTTTEKDDWDELLLYRGAGAIGYPLLALAVAVEWAVRTAFSLLVLLPATVYSLCDGGHTLAIVLLSLPCDAVEGIDLVLRCCKGFVKNFYEDKFDFQSLALGQCCYDPDVQRLVEKWGSGAAATEPVSIPQGNP